MFQPEQRTEAYRRILCVGGQEAGQSGPCCGEGTVRLKEDEEVGRGQAEEVGLCPGER